jgi:hypothetical protein
LPHGFSVFTFRSGDGGLSLYDLADGISALAAFVIFFPFPRCTHSFKLAPQIANRRTFWFRRWWLVACGESVRAAYVEVIATGKHVQALPAFSTLAGSFSARNQFSQCALGISLGVVAFVI